MLLGCPNGGVLTTSITIRFAITPQIRVLAMALGSYIVQPVMRRSTGASQLCLSSSAVSMELGCKST